MKNGEPVELTKKEYDAVYKIYNKYAFPMNTHKAFKHKMNLSAKDQRMMLKKENDFMRKQLQKIMPELRCAFISTTLYELFCVRERNKKIAPQKIANLKTTKTIR